MHLLFAGCCAAAALGVVLIDLAARGMGPGASSRAAAYCRRKQPRQLVFRSTPRSRRLTCRRSVVVRRRRMTISR